LGSDATGVDLACGVAVLGLFENWLMGIRLLTPEGKCWNPYRGSSSRLGDPVVSQKTLNHRLQAAIPAGINAAKLVRDWLVDREP
jgi:hypothetical protein